jgi:hypothetical protein
VGGSTPGPGAGIGGRQHARTRGRDAVIVDVHAHGVAVVDQVHAHVGRAGGTDVGERILDVARAADLARDDLDDGAQLLRQAGGTDRLGVGLHHRHHEGEDRDDQQQPEHQGDHDLDHREALLAGGCAVAGQHGR